LNPGFLKLFAWTKNFSANTQQQSSAQVWIRIYGLSQEYWRLKILFAIESSVGTPICTDHATNKPMFEREFGHFARVLVDIDLRTAPKYRVLVERTGFAFFLDLDYDNLPQFCSFCCCIGHQQANCKRSNPNLDDKDSRKNPRKKPETRKEFVTKDNRDLAGTSKAPEDNIEGDIPAELIKVDQEKVRNGNIDEENFAQAN